VIEALIQVGGRNFVIFALIESEERMQVPFNKNFQTCEKYSFVKKALQGNFSSFFVLPKQQK
jgi:hypothetical protein